MLQENLKEIDNSAKFIVIYVFDCKIIRLLSKTKKVN